MEYKVSNMSWIHNIEQLIAYIADMQDTHVMFNIELHEYKLHQEPGNNVIHDSTTTRRFWGNEEAVKFLFDQSLFGWDLLRMEMIGQVYDYNTMCIILWRSEV